MSSEHTPCVKLEFCQAVQCNRLVKSGSGSEEFLCLAYGNHRCIKTAKQFNRWLQDNNFVIVKR